MSDKINELMAVEVMGAKSRKETGVTVLTFPDGPEYQLNDWVMDAQPYTPFFKTYPYWTPTTDMNQAMKCVEKMQEWEIDISIRVTGRKIVSISRRHPDMGKINNAIHRFVKIDETALAICKAILKAKGINDNNSKGN